MSIVTKSGDKGETGLLSGERVSKSDPRVAAYGTLDELVSVLGAARGFKPVPEIFLNLKQIQRDLFRLGAELASSKLDPRWKVTPMAAADVEQLEGWVNRLEPELGLPKSFVLPTGSPAAGMLDIARTVARRLERELQGLLEKKLFQNREALRYVNRLSDLLFVFARYEQKQSGVNYEPV
ncbi:MAG: cob(I)yrinic acid a,c-diamide adenosyltransferase [Deltaproteobacteria bacterium]|nr:cob(I)yrinic acid a,c-diamide adenosyltransferase [Deltaproteobacteria bacterium]